MIGKTFGRLTVIERRTSNKAGNAMFLCECSCGTEKTVMAVSLRNGNTQSCGCLRIERVKQAVTTHSMSKHPLMSVWDGMMRRCYKMSARYYKDYGGRGIVVCERWHAAGNFIADNKKLYRPGRSLDRIDNDGPYSPENCQWSTSAQQARNKRNNRLLTYRGKTQCVTDWAKEIGVAPEVLFSRILRYGWSTKKALTTRPNKAKSAPHMISFKGRTQSLMAWSRELGINYQTLSMRLKTYKWSTEKALTTK